MAKEKAAIRKEMDKELKAEKRKVREEMKKTNAKQKQSAAAAARLLSRVCRHEHQVVVIISLNSS